MSNQKSILTSYARIHHYSQKTREWQQLGSRDGFCKIHIYLADSGARSLIQVVGRSDVDRAVVMNAEIKYSTQISSTSEVAVHWGSGSGAWGLTFRNAGEKSKFDYTTSGLQSVIRKQAVQVDEQKKKEAASVFPALEAPAQPTASASASASASDGTATHQSEPAKIVAKPEPAPAVVAVPTSVPTPTPTPTPTPSASTQESSSPLLSPIDNENDRDLEPPRPTADVEIFRKLINRVCSVMDVRLETAVQSISLVLEELEGYVLPDDIKEVLDEAALLEAPEGEKNDLDAFRSRTEIVTERMSKLLTDVYDMVEDYQSRNWSSQDDTSEIMDVLVSLAEMFEDNEEGILEAIRDDGRYTGMFAIADFFIGETGAKEVRAQLLKVMGLLCAILPEGPKKLAETDLAVFLAKQIQKNVDENSSEADVQLLHYSLALGTVLFSSDADIALSIFELLDVDFVNHVLNLIEESAEGTSIAAVMFLLSFNLCFKRDMSSNIVIDCIQKRVDNTKVLGQEVVQFANDAEDPVGSNSVIKFLEDIFANKETAGMLYTNDLNALCAVIARELSNLDPDSPLRTRYLDIYYGLMTNADYDGTRADDILAVLRPVMENELSETHVTEEFREKSAFILETMMMKGVLSSENDELVELITPFLPERIVEGDDEEDENGEVEGEVQ